MGCREYGEADTRRCVIEHIAFRSNRLAPSVDGTFEIDAGRAVQHIWGTVVQGAGVAVMHSEGAAFAAAADAEGARVPAGGAETAPLRLMQTRRAHQLQRTHNLRCFRTSADAAVVLLGGTLRFHVSKGAFEATCSNKAQGKCILARGQALGVWLHGCLASDEGRCCVRR